MERIRIIVVDAQELVADGLRLRIASVPDMEITAHAGSGKALFERLATHPAELVLMDVSLPGMDGIDAARLLHEKHPEVLVLAHSALQDIEYVNSMLIEGARGYLLKGATTEEFVEAVRTVMDGKQYISAPIREHIAAGYAHTGKRMDGEYIGLTERERQVITLIARERTNDEIAAALHVSTDTIKTHRKNLMTKLNVRSTAGLVKYAIDRCWI